MNDYACRDVDELLVAYAADALEEDEQCAVSTHLAECRNHDEELQSIRAGFERVAITVEPVDPPGRLRSGLLDAFDRAVAGEAAPARLRPASAPPGLAPPAPAAGPGRFSFSGLGYALAAALLVLAVGLGAWGLSRNGDSGVVTTATSAGDASLEVTYIDSQGLAVIDIEAPPLPAGMAYQAWQMRDGVPVSLGVLDAGSGRFALQADLEGADAVAISVEPAAGSAAPTTTPILIASLEG